MQEQQDRGNSSWASALDWLSGERDKWTQPQYEDDSEYPGDKPHYRDYQQDQSEESHKAYKHQQWSTYQKDRTTRPQSQTNERPPQGYRHAPGRKSSRGVNRSRNDRDILDVWYDVE